MLFRSGWDEERKLFGERPLHDWTSHPADAFRYLAVGLRGATEGPIPYFPRPPHRAPMYAITERGGNEPPPTLRDGTPIVVVEE